MSRFAEVVVNAPVRRRKVVAGRLHASDDDILTGFSPFSLTFHYSIPEELQNQIALGQMVWVPFGPRRLQGFIVGLSDTSPVAQTKDLYEIADPQPALLPQQIELARWMSAHYLAPLIDCVLLMTPPGLERSMNVIVEVNPTAVVPATLTANQRAILDVVQRGRLTLRELGKTLKLKDWRVEVERLVRKGLLLKRSELHAPRVRPKTERVVRLVSESAEMLKRAPKQRQVIEYLKGKGKGVRVAEVYAATGATAATLEALAARGLIAVEEQAVWRDPLAGREFVLTEAPRLTSDQEAVWQVIVSSLRSQVPSRKSQEEGRETYLKRGTVFLLHGVTGSGKTEIYLRTLEEVLAQGKQAIVLVPEIALTPQTVRRFAARFPGRLTVIHSKLSLGERYDQWRRIRAGEVDIVIGSRSALFVPMPRLGLIVIDEEHEWTYKQDKSPRYHARQVALKLAQLTGAVVILGSATPDVESYWRATQGEYTLLRLPQRILGHRQRVQEQRERYAIRDAKYGMRPVEGVEEALYAELPPVQVVDLRAELRAGNTSIFSRALQEAITVALAAGEQVILFLNRRGTATFIMCRDCGHVLKCPRCEVPFAFHSAEDDLVCHHCNRRALVPPNCPKCWSGRIKFFGIGTQKVEEVVKQLWPQARTLRWDRDVTGGKLAHEKILEQFVAHEADVLIGTQMIAKGLDLPLVTLVGVVTADTALHLPDFRCGERTFQILTQVAGRAGRSLLGGKVIVQTYTPEHPTIQAAARHDYAAFYRPEIEFRQQQGYPPFGQLVKLVYVGTNDKRCQEEAERLQRVLRNQIARLGLPDLDLIGPAPAFIRRVRGQYRWQIVVRGRDPHALLRDLALPLGWRVDVEPVSLL